MTMGVIGYADSDGTSAELCDGKDCGHSGHVEHGLSK